MVPGAGLAGAAGTIFSVAPCALSTCTAGALCGSCSTVDVPTPAPTRVPPTEVDAPTPALPVTCPRWFTPTPTPTGPMPVPTPAETPPVPTPTPMLKGPTGTPTPTPAEGAHPASIAASATDSQTLFIRCIVRTCRPACSGQRHPALALPDSSKKIASCAVYTGTEALKRSKNR